MRISAYIEGSVNSARELSSFDDWRLEQLKPPGRFARVDASDPEEQGNFLQEPGEGTARCFKAKALGLKEQKNFPRESTRTAVDLHGRARNGGIGEVRGMRKKKTARAGRAGGNG